MTQTVYNELPRSDALLSIRDVMARVCCSRPTVYRLMAKSEFPRPAFRSGPRFTRWASRDVDAWLANPSAWIDANKPREGAAAAVAVTA